MNTVLATLKACVLLAIVVSPNVAKSQDTYADTYTDDTLAVGDNDTLAVGELAQIPALSYMDEDTGMLAIPAVNLSDAASVLATQELIGNQSCDCTSSGFSGISLFDNGTLITYGNTTFVGCSAHDEMLRNEGVAVDGEPKTACYVVGGTGCAEATPSALQNTTEAFKMAAWRECNPLSSKTFGCFICKGYGKSSSYFSSSITIQQSSYHTYSPPVCGYCVSKPPVCSYCKPVSTGYCGGGGAAAAAAAGGGAAAAAAAGGSCGGAAAAAAASG